MRPSQKQRRAKALQEVCAWQIAEIEKGLVEADAGDFATQEEVDAMFGKWGATPSIVALPNHKGVLHVLNPSVWYGVRLAGETCR